MVKHALGPLNFPKFRAPWGPLGGTLRKLFIPLILPRWLLVHLTFWSPVAFVFLNLGCIRSSAFQVDLVSPLWNSLGVSARFLNPNLAWSFGCTFLGVPRMIFGCAFLGTLSLDLFGSLLSWLDNFILRASLLLPLVSCFGMSLLPSFPDWKYVHSSDRQNGLILDEQTLLCNSHYGQLLEFSDARMSLLIFSICTVWIGPLDGKVGVMISDGHNYHIIKPRLCSLPPLGSHHQVQLCSDSHIPMTTYDPILWRTIYPLFFCTMERFLSPTCFMSTK